MSGGRATSDLPFGSEFSPSQIHLPDLLEIVFDHQGKVKDLEAAIQTEYFSTHAQQPGEAADQDYNRAKLANNCKLGMIAYGIIDRAAKYKV